MNEKMMSDDCTEPTGLVRSESICDAIDQLPDDLLASGDPLAIREALAAAVSRVERDAAWREQLTGAGLDSPAGRRVLSAVRHAIRVIDCHHIANNIMQVRTAEHGARLLASSLSRIEHDARAEVEAAVPDLIDVFRLPSGALWAIPRDRAGQPLMWEREQGRLVAEPRMDRDRAIANLGQVCGSGWRKARVGSAETVPAAEAICRSERGAGDVFERALEAEIAAEES